MTDLQQIANIQMSKDIMNTYTQVDGLSLQNFFISAYNSFPCCQMFTQEGKENDNYFDIAEMIKFLKGKYGDKIEFVTYTTKNFTTKKSSFAFCATIKEYHLFFRAERDVEESYILYDFEHEEQLLELVEDIIQFRKAPEAKENRIYNVACSQSGYHLVKATIKDTENLDINKNYNDDFLHEHEKIKRFIEEDKKPGICLLYGVRGTGKTTYIRHLISLFKEKKFIFIPSSLVSFLGDPSFTSFIATLTESIIIIEDCEGAIRSREDGHNNASAISTLLNLSDGLQGDSLGLKFLCTFNTNISNIDNALMRKGRLVSKYDFKELSLEKTKNLLSEIYADNEDVMEDLDGLKKGMALCDIYNYTEDSYEHSRKKITL